VLLQVFYQLRIGRLVADGVIDIVSAHRARSFARARGRLRVADQERQRLRLNCNQANGIFSGGLIDSRDRILDHLRAGGHAR